MSRHLPLQQHVDAGCDGQEAICDGQICTDDLMDQVDDGLDPLAVLNHVCGENNSDGSKVSGTQGRALAQQQPPSGWSQDYPEFSECTYVPSLNWPSSLTCSGNYMKEHLDLTGEERPAAVRVLPAYQVSPVIQHDLSQSALRYAKVSLTP